MKDTFSGDDESEVCQYPICQYQAPDMNSELIEMNKDIMAAMLDQQTRQSQMNQELMQMMVMQQIHQSELMFQQQQMFQNQMHEQQMMMLQLMLRRHSDEVDVAGNDDENVGITFSYDDPAGEGNGLD